MPEKQGDIQAYYDTVATDYYKQYQRETLMTSGAYPANYFRLQILVNRLANSQAKKIYEVGVGDGTPLVTLAKQSLYQPRRESGQTYFAVSAVDELEGSPEAPPHAN